MNYYEQNDRKGRVWGIIGVVLYIVVCVGVMFITYIVKLPEPREMGVLIDFGTSDTGSGEEDLALSEQDAVPATPQQQGAAAEPVMTADEPTAPEIVTERRPAETPQPAEPAQQTAQQRQVNQRALFPGRTEGSSSTSQGSGTNAGNQGAAEGSPGGSGSEGGTGSSGFSLSGRYLIGNLPRPAYSADAEGRVVIRITVNSAGNVTSAVYEPNGSTTNHGELVGAARAAAAKARFTASESEIQTGTITYIFKLN